MGEICEGKREGNIDEDYSKCVMTLLELKVMLVMVKQLAELRAGFSGAVW